MNRTVDGWETITAERGDKWIKRRISPATRTGRPRSFCHRGAWHVGEATRRIRRGLDPLQDPDTVRNPLARSLEVAGRGSEQIGQWRLIPRWRLDPAVTIVSWPKWRGRSRRLIPGPPSGQTEARRSITPPLAETA